MAIKRLTPTVRKLGYLRLWRDDIAELVGYAEQIADVKISMEADGNRLDDVQSDLPKIGGRLNYFTLTATRPDATGEMHEVLKVHLSREGCLVEADNPDAEIRGIIADIEAAAKNYRRLPLMLPNLQMSLAAPPTRFGGLYVFGVAGSFLLIILSALSLWAGQYNIIIPPPWDILTGTVGAIMLVLVLINESRCRTILATATRSESPTGWQEYRGHIAIAIISGLAFFLLGSLVHF